LQIFYLIAVDILLGGDNAVVISLAAGKVPKADRNKAIIGGMIGAIVLRIVAAAFLVQFLEWSFVQAIGGLVLLKIAYGLIIKKDEEQKPVKASDKIWVAIRTIAIADISMSIDNVVALASITNSIWMILLGIIVSIPVIVYFANILTNIMEKFPIIIYAGGGLLAFIATKMILQDKGVAKFIAVIPEQFNLVISAIMAILLVAFVFIKNNIAERQMKTMQ
jgi:YjbE family integral membrane protein